MAQTASDVISEDDVRAVVDKIRNQKYQNRMAFREYDATDNDSNKVSFPVSDENFDGEVAEVPPGAEYPRSSKDYDEVDAVHTKYGFEVAIEDEKVQDNVIDIVLDQEEDMIRAEESRVDAVAFNVLSSNAVTPGIGDGDGTIVYSDVQQARQQAFLNELNMGSLMLLTGGQNMTDFTNMDEFTQASELGDQVIEQGVLPGGDLVGELPHQRRRYVNTSCGQQLRRRQGVATNEFVFQFAFDRRPPQQFGFGVDLGGWPASDHQAPPPSV